MTAARSSSLSGARVARHEDDRERAVVPELVDRAGVEPLPDLGAGAPQVGDDRPRVGERVGALHPQDRGGHVGRGEVVDHLLLARLPRRRVARRLRLPGRLAVDGLGARLHDARHLAAVALPDLLGLHARVLDRVVQQPRDRLRLGAAVVQHQRGHLEQVRGVRDPGALAHLRAVELDRPLDCAREPVAEHGPEGRHGVVSRLHAPSPRSSRAPRG